MACLVDEQTLSHLSSLIDEFGLVDLKPDNGFERRVSQWLSVPIGSHVAVKRGAIYHHGITSENGTVIHLFGSSFADAVIREGSDEEFLRNDTTFFEIVYENDDEHHRERTLHRARALCERLTFTAGLYDIFNFNCETFAVLCRTGTLRFRDYIPLTLTIYFYFLPKITINSFKDPTKLKR